MIETETMGQMQGLMGLPLGNKDQLRYSVTVYLSPSDYRKITRMDFNLNGEETIEVVMEQLIGPLLNGLGYSNKSVKAGMQYFIKNV